MGWKLLHPIYTFIMTEKNLDLLHKYIWHHIAGSIKLTNKCRLWTWCWGDRAWAYQQSSDSGLYLCVLTWCGWWQGDRSCSQPIENNVTPAPSNIPSVQCSDNPTVHCTSHTPYHSHWASHFWSSASIISFTINFLN